MVNHLAIQLACRARALTLEVCTTGSTTLAATGSTYTRAAGSFVTDGFAVGMEVTPSGAWSDTTKRVVTAVTATVLTVDGTPTAQVAASGRTLSVGLPSNAGWENVGTATEARVPMVEERYIPGATRRRTLGSFGQLEVLPIYELTFHGRTGADVTALASYADALIEHFAPDTPLTVGSDTARVRGLPAPTRSAIRTLEGGAAFTTVSIPLTLDTANSR
jgi:hypothetical protein